LKEFAAENGKKVRDLTAEAMKALLAYAWPGNVRELRTALEHAVVLCRGERISLRDLPASVRGQSSELAMDRPPVPPGGTLSVKEAEKDLIIRALKECDSNRTVAARKLGVSRRTLHRKLRAYHLEES